MQKIFFIYFRKTAWFKLFFGSGIGETCSLNLFGPDVPRKLSEYLWNLVFIKDLLTGERSACIGQQSQRLR